MKKLALVLVLAAAGCGSPKTETKPAVELGAALFHDHTLSGSSYNRFSCATCHSTDAAEDATRVFPGGNLADAANRPSWFDGYSLQFLDSVNFCQLYFMRGQPFAPGDPDGDALYEYLASISPDPTPPAVSYTLLQQITGLPAGDPVNGANVYAAACQVCHGDKGSGHGRISSSTTVLNQQLSADYDSLFPGTPHNLIVTEKVRHGQFYGIGGNMPFFSEEKLPDSDLTDLEAYLGL
jgi:thiosulfate dehydrogenase